ncbi:MAG: DUF1330 domain-containing protein [Pseudomonadota bacterium]
MSVYLIAEITVTDDSWIPDYAAKVHDMVASHGGRYLARSGNIEVLEGEEGDTTLIAILEFPDRDSVIGFAQSAGYAPHAKARQAGSVSRFRLIDDTDIAGTIPYLKAG